MSKLLNELKINASEVRYIFMNYPSDEKVILLEDAESEVRKNQDEILVLATELKEYVQMFGTHNKHINNVADKLIELVK